MNKLHWRVLRKLSLIIFILIYKICFVFVVSVRAHIIQAEFELFLSSHLHIFLFSIPDPWVSITINWFALSNIRVTGIVIIPLEIWLFTKIKVWFVLPADIFKSVPQDFWFINLHYMSLHIYIKLFFLCSIISIVTFIVTLLLKNVFYFLFDLPVGTF